MIVEQKLMQEGVQGLMLSGCIVLFMSFKLNIHNALLMQSVMVPFGMLDNNLFKKYCMGGTEVYGEFSSKPIDTKKSDERTDDDSTPTVEILEEKSHSEESSSTTTKRKNAGAKDAKITDLD